MFDKFATLLAKMDYTGPVYGKIRLTSIRGVSPYVRMPTYVSSIESHGIPIIQDDTITIPPYDDIDLLHSPEYADLDLAYRGAAMILPLMITTFRALGIPVAFTDQDWKEFFRMLSKDG